VASPPPARLHPPIGRMLERVGDREALGRPECHTDCHCPVDLGDRRMRREGEGLVLTGDGDPVGVPAVTARAWQAAIIACSR